MISQDSYSMRFPDVQPSFRKICSSLFSILSLMNGYFSYMHAVWGACTLFSVSIVIDSLRLVTRLSMFLDWVMASKNSRWTWTYDCVICMYGICNVYKAIFCADNRYPMKIKDRRAGSRYVEVQHAEATIFHWVIPVRNWWCRECC